MTLDGLVPIDSTVQVMNLWLHEILEQTSWRDRHRAYQALRVVLHALRDRLPLDQVVALAAQLPMLVRGCYYEGWKLKETSFKDRSAKAFFAQIGAAFRDGRDADPKKVARAVFRVLAMHVSNGEIEEVKHALPMEVRVLWD